MSEDMAGSIMEQVQKNIVLITLVVASIILRIFLAQREQDATNKKKAEEVVPTKPARLNNKVKLENEKVVDTLKCPDIETLEACKAGKVVMCRCWKSEKFPYCDGSHNAHNKETGDNVGPLIIETGK